MKITHKIQQKEDNQKTGKNFNKYSTKEDIGMADKHMRRYYSLGKCKLKSQ